MTKTTRVPAYREPVTLAEAHARRTRILLEQDRVDRQLADEVGQRARFQKESAFKSWRSKANLAKKHMRDDVLRLEAWIAAHSEVFEVRVWDEELGRWGEPASSHASLFEAMAERARVIAVDEVDVETDVEVFYRGQMVTLEEAL